MFLNIVLSFLLILIMIFLCKRNYFEGFWPPTSQETTYSKPGNFCDDHSPGKHHHGICICPAGTGLASSTADTCSRCQGESYNDGTKQMCEACDRNEVANRNKDGCRCKDGTSRSSRGTCQDCQRGYAGTGGTCNECIASTQYQPNTGQTECVDVGAGYYKYDKETRGHCELQFYHNDQLHTHGDPWRSSGIKNGDCVTFAHSSPAYFYDTTNWPYYEYRGWINEESPRRVQILAKKANGEDDAPNHSKCKLESYSESYCTGDNQSHTGPLEKSHDDKRKFNYVQSINFQY